MVANLWILRQMNVSCQAAISFLFKKSDKFTHKLGINFDGISDEKIMKHFKPEKWRIAQIFSSKQRFKRTFSWTNNFSPKMPMFVCISKKPNWVPAEWCWRLRFESTLNYFVKILRNNNKISHCALKSQPSAPFSCTQFGFFEIQTNMGIFWKDSFFYHKCPLEALF